MTTGAAAEREAARLAALHSCAILDTRPEADFDDFASIAAELCGASTGVVAFVDETRWWAKARIGAVPESVPRDDLLCRTAFDRGEPLVIEDLAAYEFRPVAAEVGPGARFYAALPLLVDERLPIGVLCVAAPMPVILSPGQRAGLARIARGLVRLLAFRRHSILLAEAHEALAVGEAQYRLLADTAPDAIITVEEDGRIVFANPATEQLFGYSPDEIVGQPFTVLLPPAEREAALAGFQRQLDSDEPLRVACAAVQGARRDGAQFALEISCGEGRVGDRRSFTAVLRDVSDRHRAEQALVKAREQAEEASRLKSEFLANMSHEIRTPMNGVLGMLDLVLEEPMAAAQRSRLERARESAQALLGIINDILDLSKIEAGRFELEPRWEDPRALVAAVAGLIRPLAEAKGLALDDACEASVPRRVLVDGGRLRQVLVNLLGNAVKFTDAGLVAIRIRTGRPVRAGTVHLRFSVEDTGIGIPREQIARVWEKFTQLDGAANRRVGGTGLGLSICARLVELMGGTISVTSEPGRGSHFAVELDLETSDAADVPAVPPVESPTARVPVAAPAGSPPARPRVFLVEDNPVNQEFAVAVLRSVHCDVRVASDGHAAVEALLASSPEVLPDVILMDCQMPVMDGYEATRRLRQAGVRVPILALTANAMESDRQRCAAAGMDDVLVKPIRPDELRAAIGRLARVATPAAVPAGDIVERPAWEEAPAGASAAFVEDRVGPVVPADGDRAGATTGAAASSSPIVIDEDAVLERIGGNVELYLDIARLFIEHSVPMLAAVAEAAERREADTLASAAHAMKGSISTFLQTGPYVTASSMEHAATDGDVDGACALLPRLTDEIAALRATLEARVAAATVGSL